LTTQPVIQRKGLGSNVVTQSFGIAGQPVTLRRSYRSAISSEAFTAASNTVGTKRVLRTFVQSSTAVVATINLGLRVSRKAAIGAASFSVVPQTIGLNRNYRSIVQPTSFLITSIPEASSRSVFISSTFFTLSSQQVNPRVKYYSNVSAASFVVTPKSVGTVYGKQYTTSVDSQNINVVCQSISLNRSYRSNAQSHPFIFNPESFTTYKKYVTSIQGAQSTVDAKTVRALVTRYVGVSSTTFGLTDQNINTVYGKVYVCSVEPLSVSVSCQPVSIIRSYLSVLQTSNAAINSQPIGTFKDYKTLTNQQQYNIVSQSLSVSVVRPQTGITTGSFVVACNDIGLFINRRSTIDGSSSHITAQNVFGQYNRSTVVQTQSIVADTKNIQLDIIERPLGQSFVCQVATTSFEVVCRPTNVFKKYYCIVGSAKYNINLKAIRCVEKAAWGERRVVRVKKRNAIVKIPQRRNVVRIKRSATTGQITKMYLTWETKDPSSKLDYTVDWTDWLDGDTIVEASAVLDEDVSNLVIESTTIKEGRFVCVVLSGGTANTTGAVNVAITTSAGKYSKATVRLLVRALD
jgi:hypothetical protein